jgi:hypothetical protein
MGLFREGIDLTSGKSSRIAIGLQDVREPVSDLPPASF